MTNEIYGKFYNPNRLISTGKPICMSVGSRSIGKSTGFALYLLVQYYEHKKKFIYTRRTDDELKRTASDYFGTALSILSDFGMAHSIALKGDEYIDENNDTIGYAIPLNAEQKYKSHQFGELGVRNILYDEFILPKGGEKGYLGGSKNCIYEYRRLVSLYQTVDRTKGHAFTNQTRIFACANNGSFYNPLFIACNCDQYVDMETKFCNPKDEIWALEMTSQVEGTKEIKHSYGYLMADKNERRRNYDNDSFQKDAQVGKVTFPKRSFCNLLYNGNHYGVYLVEKLGVIYIERKPAENALDIALTVGDTKKINQLTAYKFKDSPFMILIRNLVNSGNVIYETQGIKNDVLTYLNFTL